MNIVVTIPTFNEAENIERLVRSLLDVDDNVQVIVSDDDSPDGTWSRVGALAAKDSRVHLQHRKRDKGRGHAGRDAFCAALALGADVVVEMDGDGSHDPRDLPRMLAALAEADVVLGSRLVPGGKDTRDSWSRHLLTSASCTYTRLILGLPVRDVNSGYRAFWSRSLRAVDVHRCTSPGPAIVHELLYKAYSRHLRIVEVPITFRDRDKGTSELDVRRLLRSFLTVIKLRWRGLRGTLFAGPLPPPPVPLADVVPSPARGGPEPPGPPGPARSEPAPSEPDHAAPSTSGGSGPR